MDADPKTPELDKDDPRRSMERPVRWFVRGRRSNGTRWESGHRYPTKEQAEAEMAWWDANATDTGEMNVWREIFPAGGGTDEQAGSNSPSAPGGNPSNANVDLPDTAAQDSDSKANSPAVSG